MSTTSAEQRAIHHLQIQRNTAMDMLADALVAIDMQNDKLLELQQRMPALEARLAAIEAQEKSDGDSGITCG